jgi:hypothetical protein
MVIFHSYVNVYQRVSVFHIGFVLPEAILDSFQPIVYWSLRPLGYLFGMNKTYAIMTNRLLDPW